MYAKKDSNIKVIAALLAIVLLIGCGIGGTIAYLTMKTGTITNTFTNGDVTITLTETTGTEYQLVPGKEYSKDPVVAVSDTTNVDCYLFVKFEEKNAPATYLTYTSTLTTANGWTNGDGTNIPADVWYREVGANDATKSWNLLENNKVTVNTTVTKNNMADAAEAQLAYTAYAIQKDGFATAAAAWAEVGK